MEKLNMTLVDELRKRQGTKTQIEFAAELGINQGMLSRIYSGDRNIGARIAKRIKNRFPELAFEIAAFLLTDNMTQGQAVKTA